MDDDEEVRRRASGKTPAEEVTEEVAEEAEKPLSVDLPDERERRFRTVGFARLQTTWQGNDALMMTRVHKVVEDRVHEQFADVFQIMYELYDVVRKPEMEGDEPLKDEYGLTVWERTNTGGYIEDWDRVGVKQRERFLYLITTRLFDWKQRAAEAWGESMFSKGIWRENFAEGFESLPKVSATRPTVEDRTQRGHLDSREQYYFAILLSYFSRKADALVYSMELLAQRLKDVHTA